MADLILVARDGYAVSGDATGDAFVVPTEGTTGAHGYLATEPKMNALFVASGAGIEAGAKLASGQQRRRRPDRGPAPRPPPAPRLRPSP